MAAYGVTEGGNFEGRSILYVARTAAELARRRGIDAAELDHAARARPRGALRGSRERV